MKRLVLVAALFIAGVAAAVAFAASTTGSVSVCATSPAQTIADNGAPIATVPATSACATTTYTVSTETVTTTVANTTTTTTTTPATPTFASETAYTQTRRTFTPQRTVTVASAAALKAAIANLQPGDLVEASAPFTVTSSTSSVLVIANRLTAPAVIDLAGVNVAYTGTSNYAGIYLKDPSNVRLYGGDVTTGQGGSCILAHGAQNVLWWGFNAHNCGGDGVSLLIAQDGGPVTNDDFEGEVSHPGQNLAWDPHVDKGTGLHCAGEMADADTTFAFTGNRLAFYCHDDPVGAAFAFGSAPVLTDLGFATSGQKNTLILEAANLDCTATTQTCGNGVELWGLTDQMGLDIKYLEVTGAYGYPFYDKGVSSGSSLAGVTVDYARAVNDELHPYPTGQPFWGEPKGQTYKDVVPAP